MKDIKNVYRVKGSWNVGDDHESSTLLSSNDSNDDEISSQVSQPNNHILKNAVIRWRIGEWVSLITDFSFEDIFTFTIRIL